VLRLLLPKTKHEGLTNAQFHPEGNPTKWFWPAWAKRLRSFIRSMA